MFGNAIQTVVITGGRAAEAMVRIAFQGSHFSTFHRAAKVHHGALVAGLPSHDD